MDHTSASLTLDQPTGYEVRVPGCLDEAWCDWIGGMSIAVGVDEAGDPITTLTGTVDQAALHGLLRRLYSLGIPVLSVTCLPCGASEPEE